MPLNGRRNPSRKMKERVEIRIRKQFEDGLEHRFAAAHAGQPVMDDGNAWKRRSEWCCVAWRRLVINHRGAEWHRASISADSRVSPRTRHKCDRCGDTPQPALRPDTARRHDDRSAPEDNAASPRRA